MTRLRSVAARSLPTNDLGVLWYYLARREWTTLALVSSDDDDAASRLARALVELAGTHHGVLEVRDVSELRLQVAAAMKQEASEGGPAADGRPWRFLLPIKSVLDNPHAEELLQACDTVVLLLEKGRSRLPEALSAVDLVGHERLLGAVLATP